MGASHKFLRHFSTLTLAVKLRTESINSFDLWRDRFIPVFLLVIPKMEFIHKLATIAHCKNEIGKTVIFGDASTQLLDLILGPFLPWTTHHPLFVKDDARRSFHSFLPERKIDVLDFVDDNKRDATKVN